MAEGDTILRAARRLEPALVGREIQHAEAPSPRSPLKRAAGRIAGRRVESVETRGKHLMLHLGGSLTIHSHMGMNGSWAVHAPGAAWRQPRRSAWLVIAVEGAEAAQFGGPTLRLVRTAELARDQRLARLGPDVLAPGYTAEAGARALAAAPELAVGEALLDQSLIAGVGNIFKSEGLFASRIDPWRPVGSLDEEELLRLAATVAEQMGAAVETGRRPRSVYRRAGRPCRRCRTRIRSRGQGDDNRTTYWCPGCQSRGRAVASRSGDGP